MWKIQSLTGQWYFLLWRMSVQLSGTTFPIRVSPPHLFFIKWRPCPKRIPPNSCIIAICLALIPVLGNHDVFPGDLYPSEAESFYRAYLTWETPPSGRIRATSLIINIFVKERAYPFLFSSFREGGWDELLPESAQVSFRKCGFYTLDVKSKLKVLQILFSRLSWFQGVDSLFLYRIYIGYSLEHKSVQWTQ